MVQSIAADFIAGLALARGYYHDVVARLVNAPHAAARVGWGSDVLGYDTPRSTDHGWGPHLHIFVNDEHIAEVQIAITTSLPSHYLGWPTHFGWDGVAVRHWVEVTTVAQFLEVHLNGPIDIPLTTSRWLDIPQQLLLGVTAGEVFHDDLGELTDVRQRLAWYPDDVWRYALACQWHRIAQEEHVVGRTAEVGDQLGSRIVTARLARDIMRLVLLIERQYAPYTKWLGTAFGRTALGARVNPMLLEACAATTSQQRGDALNAALAVIITAQHGAGITQYIDPTPRAFHTRPFMVIDADRVAEHIRLTIADVTLRTRPLVGTIDQWVDNTDALSHGR